MLQVGEIVTIRKEWQDAGDDGQVWRVVEGEDGGRLTITPVACADWPIPPQQRVTVDMVQRCES